MRFGYVVILVSIGALTQFSCGSECECPANTYSVAGLSFTVAPRSSAFNVNKGIMAGEEVTASISITSTQDLAYFEQAGFAPDTFVVTCSTFGSSSLFQLFITKWYKDGDYDGIIGTDGMYSMEALTSQVLKASDFDGVVALTCGLQLPEVWRRYKDAQTGEEIWEKLQEQEFIGAAKVTAKTDRKCFDWYYNDIYHEASKETECSNIDKGE